jgi:hypothetical protein
MRILIRPLTCIIISIILLILLNILYLHRTSQKIKSNKFIFVESSYKKQEKVQERIRTFTSTEWENLVLQLANENLINEKYIILSMANYGHLEFAKNFIASLILNNYKQFLIVCLDVQVYAILCRLNYCNNVVMAPKSWLFKNTDVSTNEVIWGESEYKLLTQTKVFLTLKLLEVIIN